jgi:hypothetical protein
MKTFLSIVLLTLLTASTGYPWGAQGHAAVGLVAEQRLNSSARRHIERILGDSDLASLASWMDELRGVDRDFGPLAGSAEAHAFIKQFPNSFEWHYVDLPLGESQYRDNDSFSRPDDVVHQINLAVQVLEGRSNAMAPKYAIYVIVHLVGDLHQPLHVAYGYYDLSDPDHPILITESKAAEGKESDKGANDLSLGVGRWDELHAYWDDVLPRKVAGSKDTRALAQKMTEIIAPDRWASMGDYHSWAEQWATESIVASRKVYAGIKYGSSELEDGKLRRIRITLPIDYDATAIPLARERLAKAAFHLAELLNNIDWPNPM